MSKIQKLFPNASIADDTTERKPSKNDYAYQLLETIEVEEFRTLLNRLKSKELRFIAERLHIRLLGANRITTYNAELVLSTTLKLYTSGSVEGVTQAIVRPLLLKTRETLGENFENPSARRISELTDILLAEFGPIRTKLFYADAIDGLAKAKPHLLKEIASRPELAIDLFVHDESPLEAPESRPAPTEERKVSRKEKRKSDKVARALLRKQETDARVIEKQRLLEKKRITEAESIADRTVSDTAEDVSQIAVSKLQHGHLKRYLKASTSHAQTGQVKWGFISYGKNDPDEGKVRPCVIVAVAPRYYIVRPIFSRASRYAGVWRAVQIYDWQQAGLDHESVVGHETQKITLEKIRSHIGELSLSDWNRICRGEVNAKSDFEN
jgi:hypothetical protein